MQRETPIQARRSNVQSVDDNGRRFAVSNERHRAGAGCANRDDADTEGFYLGAGLGEFSTEVDEISDVDNVDLDFDTDEDAKKIYAGWRFNRFFAVQVDQYEFGDSNLAVNLLPCHGYRRYRGEHCRHAAARPDRAVRSRGHTLVRRECRLER